MNPTVAVAGQVQQGAALSGETTLFIAISLILSVFFFFSLSYGIYIGGKKFFTSRRRAKLMRKFKSYTDLEIKTWDSAGTPVLIHYTKKNNNEEVVEVYEFLK